MIKQYLCTLFLIFTGLQAFSQIVPVNIPIYDDLLKPEINLQSSKRSIQNPKSCAVDTVGYPLLKSTLNSRRLLTVSVAKGRSLGQLYSCPSPISVRGFTFYAFVLPMHKTSKKMEIYCNLYKAGLDSLPTGAPLRSDTISIDSTVGIGLLSVIEKHVNWSAITLDSNYIITVGTNDDSLTAGVVTNDYNYRDGDRENLNSGSISGLWYNGRNLNVGGVPFDCDILLHPHVKYNFGTDFTIKNNCYNFNDSIQFVNAAPSNVSGSMMYNQYFIYNFSHLWDMGNFSGSQYSTDRKIKYQTKQNYSVRLISTVYGYKGPSANGCIDTAIKPVYFKPDIPTFSGLTNVCIGDSASFTALSNDVGVDFEWMSSPSSSTPFYVGKTYKKFPITKNDTFYLRANNNGCISGLRTIIIRANAYPTMLNVVNDSVCAGSKANLRASSDIGNIQWYKDITGGLPFYSGTVYQTIVLNKDTSFYVQANNNGCILSPRLPISALVGSNFAPDAPVLSNDTTVCLAAANTLTLNASVGSGLSVRWFNSASGGSSFQTGATLNFLPTFRQVKTFYADAYNGVCGSTRVPINITVEDFPIISNLVNDAVCKGDSSHVYFTLPYGEADWYDAASGGNLIHTGNSNAQLLSSSTDYFVESKSGFCLNPNRLKITAQVNDAPSIVKLWGDTICAKNTAKLKATLAGPGIVEWFEYDTSSVALASGTTFTTPVLNGSKKYFARTSYAGCVGNYQSVQPLVRPAPFSGFSFEVLSWQQVKVSPINAGGASIKWHFGDGTTSNNSLVIHRYTNTGTYQIKLILTNTSTGCKDSTTVTVQIDPSSVNSLYVGSKLNLYPNPSQGILNFDINTDNSVLYADIYSVNGVLVSHLPISEDLNIDISSLSAGIYVVHISGYKPTMFIKE